MWIDVDDIAHAYDGRPVLAGLSFRLEQGTIGCLLGPSGCGKTTALRRLAGLEPVLRGRIVAEDEVLSAPGHVLAPERREIGMVFQDYALFPHLTVSENVGFGLARRDAGQRRDVVARLLDVVGLAGESGQYPHQLSGGQQQRVALARALAPAPRLLLLDEPFSNLDASMRVDLGAELREILKRLGITALLVTHDQQEAFAIADEVGVMNDGRLEQWDTPAALYRRPATPFVARFVGEGCLVPAIVEADGMVRTELGVVRSRLISAAANQAATTDEVDALLRASDLRCELNGSANGRIRARAFRGADVLYHVELASGRVVKVLAPGFDDFEVDQQIMVSITASEVVVFRR